MDGAETSTSEESSPEQAAQTVLATPRVILVMYNIALPEDYADSSEPGAEAQNFTSDDESRYTANLIATGLQQTGFQAVVVGVRSTVDIERELASYDPANTLVFNMVESVDGKTFKHPEAARVLPFLVWKLTYVDIRQTGLHVHWTKCHCT